MVVAAVIRSAVVLLFLTAGLAKAFNFDSFVATTRRHRLVRSSLVPATAAAVIAVELGLSVLLLIYATERPAMIGAGALLIAFAVVSVLVSSRSGSVECGCLGSLLRLRLDRVSGATTAAFGVGAILASRAPRTSLLSSPPDAGVGWRVTAVVWMSGSALVVAYWLVGYARSVFQLVHKRSRAAA
jgi:hypothetical protein